jgi:hypothetical protein
MDGSSSSTTTLVGSAVSGGAVLDNVGVAVPPGALRVGGAGATPYVSTPSSETKWSGAVGAEEGAEAERGTSDVWVPLVQV